jgi:hypothetical protein
MKTVTLLLISIALGLASTVAFSADEKAIKAAESAIADAESYRKKAASVDGEWRDTADFIKQAQEALKAGDADKATKLANFAKRQGHYGYEQAVSQKDFKMPSYLKY